MYLPSVIVTHKKKKKKMSRTRKRTREHMICVVFVFIVMIMVFRDGGRNSVQVRVNTIKTTNFVLSASNKQEKINPAITHEVDVVVNHRHQSEEILEVEKDDLKAVPLIEVSKVTHIKVLNETK